jgi:hypothetical protein
MEVRFTRLADGQFSTLPPGDQAALRGRIDAVAADWPKVPPGLIRDHRLFRLATHDEIWVLKYDELRVAFTPADGRLEVLELVPVARVLGGMA